MQATRTVAQPSRGNADLALALGGMLALAAAMGIGRFVYTPILPAMVAGLGLTKTQAGLIASANFVGYLAGALAVTASRLPGGARAWFMGGVALSALTTTAMAAMPAMALFLLLRFLGGAASAFVLVFGSTLVLNRLAGRSSLAALHFAGVGAGIAGSAALTHVLESHGADWRGLWLGSGALAALLAPLASMLVPPGIATLRPAGPSSPGLPKGLPALSLCHGLFGFGYVVTATFLVAVVRSAPTARSLEPVVWLVVGLAAIPSTALWAWAGARWGALPAYAAACLLEAAGVLAGGLWITPVGALTASVLLGGTFMGITTLGFTAARGLAPARQRQSFALVTVGFGIGQIVGPVLAGWLMDRTGSFAPSSVIAAAALCIGAMIALRTAWVQRG